MMDIRTQLNRGGEFNARHACTQSMLWAKSRSTPFQHQPGKIGKVSGYKIHSYGPLPVHATQANVVAWAVSRPSSLFRLRSSSQYTTIPQGNKMRNSYQENAGIRFSMSNYREKSFYAPT